MSDGYFLSPRNPIATTDQRELDALALQLWARPDVQKAKEAARHSFALVASETMTAETFALLPAYAESFAMRSIQLAVNSDADHPRVYQVYRPANKWLGNDLPESRWGQENPDNIYRIIPIARGGRYVVKGKQHANPPADVSYVLVADTNTSVMVGMLGQKQLDVAADGSFAITLDETPADGRSNHIQIAAEDARYLFIRDSMSDWRQTPNALQVERLNPPSRAPLTIDELAARAARVMQLGVAPAYYWSRLVLNAQAGHMSQPQGTGPSGGLATQQTSHGWLSLKDGEAAVVTFDPIEAAYCSIVLYDVWGRTLEYRDHLTSFNTSQMVADADGRFTFVIAAQDPGVHNWLDTMGLHELCLGIRWQAVSPNAKLAPKVSGEVIKAGTPTSARPIGAEGRAKQLLERAQSYDLRLRES